MTSNSSKMTTKDQTGRNSSSEESERKGRMKQHQKITSPTSEKKTIREANFSWRRFNQYVKMTKDIDLTIMKNDEEVLNHYRDELEVKIKDIFIWALGEGAVTEMTKTVRDNDPNKVSINQL